MQRYLIEMMTMMNYYYFVDDPAVVVESLPIELPVREVTLKSCTRFYRSFVPEGEYHGLENTGKYLLLIILIKSFEVFKYFRLKGDGPVFSLWTCQMRC